MRNASVQRSDDVTDGLREGDVLNGKVYPTESDQQTGASVQHCEFRCTSRSHSARVRVMGERDVGVKRTVCLLSGVYRYLSLGLL